VNKADPEHILVRVDPQYFRPTEVCIPHIRYHNIETVVGWLGGRGGGGGHWHADSEVTNGSALTLPDPPPLHSTPVLCCAVQVDLLLGDPTKAKKVLGWVPEVSFDVRACLGAPLYYIYIYIYICVCVCVDRHA
jgi:hypothetical protein